MNILHRLLHPIDTLRRCLWVLCNIRVVSKCAIIQRSVLSMRETAGFEEEIEFLRKYGFYTAMPFPYPKVRPGVSDCVVRYDDVLQLPFVESEDGKLYFPADRSRKIIAGQYLGYVNDEGITERGCRLKSPHLYVEPGFRVEEGDVILDVGSAEALFTLHNINKASRAYVFEASTSWASPLKATFAPFESKVTIISKFVSSKTGGDFVRLQDAIEDDPSKTYFIKMDIEGCERDALSASREFLMTHRVKLSCCVYHRQDDDEVISGMLADMGFRISHSDGYMLVRMGTPSPPYFRRGVIHAVNFS